MVSRARRREITERKKHCRCGREDDRICHLLPSSIIISHTSRQHDARFAPVVLPLLTPAARFRAKKKAHVENVERNIRALEAQHSELEVEVADLRKENGLLKDMVQLKYGGERTL